jgi:hypothetical protein
MKWVNLSSSEVNLFVMSRGRDHFTIWLTEGEKDTGIANHWLKGSGGCNEAKSGG